MPMQTVRDVMTTHVVYLPSETTLAEAARTMREQDIGDVVVADEGHKPAGLVHDLVTVSPDDTVQSAALLMRDHAVRRVLVCGDDEDLLGIVSIGDLAEEIDPESVLGGISKAQPNN